MSQYTFVTKNGEVSFHHPSQKYHVFDETYSEVVHICDTLHDAEIALAAYCKQYLDRPEPNSIAPILDVLVAI